MNQENIIKKESKISYKKGFFSSSYGDLVLTPTELFLTDLRGRKVISIPIKEILNVRVAKNVSSVDYMFITYKADDKEKTARFMHFSLLDSSLLMGELSRVKESYFVAWQRAIEDLRQG